MAQAEPGRVTTLADLAQAVGTRRQDRRGCADPGGVRGIVRMVRVARALRRELVNNLYLVIAGLMLFVFVATNAWEHPIHKPHWKPAVSFGILGLLSCFVWDTWLIGK